MHYEVEVTIKRFKADRRPYAQPQEISVFKGSKEILIEEPGDCPKLYDSLEELKFVAAEALIDDVAEQNTDLFDDEDLVDDRAKQLLYEQKYGKLF